MSGAQYFGQALSHIGGRIAEFGSEQEKLRQQLALMAQQRADKLAEDNRATEELSLRKRADERAQAEEGRKAGAEKDNRDFMADVGKGKPAPAPEGAEIDPSAPDSERPANTPLSREEILQKALERGTLSPEKYIEYTKAKEITPTADIQDYRIAQSQGYKGSFVEFLKAKANATHIDVTGAADIRAGQAERGRLGGQNASDPQVKTYKNVKGFARGMVADYENYKKALGSKDEAGIKAHQQALIDKFISISTGKSTTEAQFNLLTEKPPGVVNWINNIRSKFKYGSVVPQSVVEGMVKDGLATADALRSGVRNANEGTSTMASYSPYNIEPNSVIAIPEKQLQDDSAFFANARPDRHAEWDNHPTYRSLQEAEQKAPPGTKGVWVNGKHHSLAGAE